MGLNELKHAKGATHKTFRKGRGLGSGNGKTCGKGQKGQSSRAGHMKVGFEGGQTPIYRRLPKFGFHNPTQIKYSTINVGDLNKFDDGTTVSMELLIEEGLIKKELNGGLKVLGNGKLTKKLTVKAAKFSKGAEKAITEAGGKIEVLK